MADLQDYLFGMGGGEITVEGTITQEGGWVHLVAQLDWTAFLQWPFANDPLWAAIPRTQFDAADNPQFLGVLPGTGTVIFDYAGPDDPFGFPTPYYQGTWVTNGDDEFGGHLLRNNCYLFLDVPDEGAAGAAMHSDIDLRWPVGAGIGFGAGGGIRGTAVAADGPAGRTKTGAVRPSGRVQ